LLRNVQCRVGAVGAVGGGGFTGYNLDGVEPEPAVVV
jgi:hypothetical protein